MQVSTLLLSLGKLQFMVLKNLNYPLDFKFKITTLSSDFNITDRNGN